MFPKFEKSTPSGVFFSCSVPVAFDNPAFGSYNK